MPAVQPLVRRCQLQDIAIATPRSGKLKADRQPLGTVTWWNVPDGAWTLTRNLAGFTGLALLTARVLGSGLCWVLPLGYAVLALLAPSLVRHPPGRRPCARPPTRRPR